MYTGSQKVPVGQLFPAQGSAKHCPWEQTWPDAHPRNEQAPATHVPPEQEDPEPQTTVLQGSAMQEPLLQMGVLPPQAGVQTFGLQVPPVNAEQVYPAGQVDPSTPQVAGTQAPLVQV